MQNSSEKKNADNFILGKKHSRCLFGTRPVLQCNTLINYEQYILMSILANLSLKKTVAWLTKTLLILQVKLEGSHPCGEVDSEEGYQLLPVSGSNLFFILKQRRLNDEDKCCTSKVRRTTYRKSFNIGYQETVIPITCSLAHFTKTRLIFKPTS